MCSKNIRVVGGKRIRNINMHSECFLLEVKCTDKIVVIPRVSNRVENFRIVITKLKPKRTGPLSPHSFFMVVNSIKLIEQ